MTTRPGGFVAGDVLGAADLNLLGAGVLDYASVTADQTTITTVTDATSLTVTWTAVSSRLYRVSWRAIMNVKDSTFGTLAVYCTDSSNNVKGSASQTIPSGSADDEFTYANLSSFTLETGLSGSITRKLRVEYDAFGAGAATGTLKAAATAPAFIVVEDIGPA